MFLQTASAVLQTRPDRSRAPVHAVVHLQTGAWAWDFEFRIVSDFDFFGG